MRVLVVDQDSTLLTAITQTLGEYFGIDAVTTKADCLDLVRLNEFDVIVAGERLEDGSGLELLGSLARSRPDMLRIFAAERERLKLLKGRLGPFGLFRTLAYPIEPRQLLAALSAAAGVEAEVEEIAQAQQASAAAPPAATTLQVAPSRGQTATAATRGQASVATAAPASRAQASVATATPAPARSSPQQSHSGGSTRATPRAPSSRQVPRQPTSAALAAASKLDIVTRPKGFPPAGESSAARSAFLVGAGVILVLGGLLLSFKIFNTKDDPVQVATNLSAMRAPHFPPEVVKLVADTEVAFQQDDVKTARTDVAALQQIAPDHPRLQFFESLLKRLETTQASRSNSQRLMRHTSPPVASSGTAGPSSTMAAPGASSTSRASRPSSAPAPDTQRRQPDTSRDTAATPVATRVSTFSGRTLEDTSAGAASPSVAMASQAMATPVPRRPDSAAASSSDTQTPRLIQRVAPDYPPEAARKGVEGSVDVSLTISPQGKVSDVTVISAVPSDIFNRAAIAAVRRWKYEPKIVNGVAVEAHQQLRLQFKLDPRG